MSGGSGTMGKIMSGLTTALGVGSEVAAPGNPAGMMAIGQGVGGLSGGSATATTPTSGTTTASPGSSLLPALLSAGGSTAGGGLNTLGQGSTKEPPQPPPPAPAGPPITPVGSQSSVSPLNFNGGGVGPIGGGAINPKILALLKLLGGS